MICPKCNTQNPDGFRYCGNCGKALPLICPQCGLENPQGQAQCNHCAAPLSAQTQELFEVSMDGERRFVAVIFADIAGFTRLAEQLDPEESTLLVNRCLDELTQVIVEHGGRLVRYLGDGLMAVFGAPTAHEDDPERAVAAALTMRERISQIKLSMNTQRISLHLGVACGQVVAAGVGGQGRKEYNVLGVPVNLAARLEEVSAPDQILVSEEIARLTNRAYAYKPVTLPHLHGWEGEVRAFELLGKRSAIKSTRRAWTLPSALVGRQAEMAQLWGSLHHLLQGRGAILYLIGEVGIGKSRLLSELQSQVQERNPGITWLYVQAVEASESLRYDCFQTLFRNAIGVPAHADAAKTAALLRDHLDQQLPSRAGEIYPYLAHALGLPLPPKAHAEFEWLNEETLLWQTGRILQEWMRALCHRQKVALILEDIHWIDPASAALLEHLYPLVEELPLLILCSFRPEPERLAWNLRAKAMGEHSGHYAEIWLQPLNETEIRRLVQQILTSSQVPEAVTNLIVQRTEGNPLFIEELIHSMTDRGVLTQDPGGRWAISPDWQEVTIPNTIQGILQARIDRLGRDPKRMIHLAACVGRQFPRDLLLQIAPAIGIPAENAQSCLVTLEEADLLQPSPPPSTGEIRFKHILIRDTVYHSLLRATRAQYHAAIARWFEAHTLDQAVPPYALLAYHYEQTEDEEKKVEYFVKAGYQATQSYANHEAYLFFTKALNLISDPAWRYKLLLEREHICNLIGDRDQQRVDLEELLKLVNDGMDDAQRAIVYNRLAIWHESWGEYAAARAAFEQGLAAARRAGAHGSEAESLHRIASAAWRQGNFTEAIASAQAALEIARSVNDSSREAACYTTLGVVYRTLGDLRQAKACYQQALEIRRRLGDRREVAISLSQLGNVQIDQGAYTNALHYHSQALDLFRQAGDRRGEAWSLSGLGSAYLACGDTSTALVHFEQALSLRQAIHDRRGEGVSLSDIGNVRLAEGKTDKAIAFLRQSVQILSEIGARRDEVHALTYLARALEQAGEWDEAEQLYQKALLSRREAGQRKAALENLAGLARLALAKRDQARACKLTDEILEQIRSHGFPTSESPFLIYQTVLEGLRACGRLEEAAALLAEAQTTLRQRAEQITDPDLRRKFLENVPENRFFAVALS